MKVAEIFFVIFHLIANFVDLKNIYFAKSSLCYKANLPLQNETNFDYVQLATEVQQPF